MDVPSPAFVTASKPPPAAADLESGAALPLSSSAPPVAAAVAGKPLSPDDDPFRHHNDLSIPLPNSRLSPSFVGWLLFAIGWLVALVWIIGLPLANALPSSCGAQAQRLMSSGNPLAQLVAYERLRSLVECRVSTNIALTATGALCLIPWLLGSLVPCCCTSRKALDRAAAKRGLSGGAAGGCAATLAAAKSRRSRAAGANTMMAVAGVAALAGLIAMVAVETREARKMDTPEARAQLESLSQAAKAGQQAATAVDGIIEQVTQALGIPAPEGVGNAANGEGLLGRLFKP
jgi:hypothetical protein